MFCSEECKKEATKGYHQYECEVIDRVALFFREFYKVLMVFRQLFKALAICGGSAAELKELLTTDNSRNVLDFDYDSEMFRSDPKQHLVASFASNINLLPWSKSRKKEEKLMFSKFLRLFPKLRRTYQNAEEKKFVLTFLVTQSRFAFSTDFEYGAEIEKWVGGVYPLRSYMKSSCLPNVVGYIYDRCSVVYIAQERLKAGCLVTVQHSALMVEDWFYKRGEHFLKTFATNCTCLACVRNYRPVLEIRDLEEMKSLSNVFREKLGFARALGAEQTLLNNYYKDLQQIWKREPNMEMVKKWFGMSIYNVSQSATLNITRHLTDLGDKID